MVTAEVIYDANDMLLSVTGLRNAATAAYLNSATVTATLVDALGVTVTGQSFPLTLAYVASSNGNYRGTLEDTLNTIVGDILTAQVTADAGPALRGYWEVPCQVQTRVS